MKVEITKKMFGGNFGDMLSYAETYTDILGDLWDSRAQADYPGAEIEIEIDFQAGVEGSEPEVQVFVDGKEIDNMLYISDEGKAWQKTIDIANLTKQ